MTTRTAIFFLGIFVVSTFSACSCEETTGGPTTPGTSDVGADAGVVSDVSPDAEGNPCEAEPARCRPDQQCTVAPSGLAECRCPAGTSEVSGTCVADEECTETTCNRNGTCSNGEDGPVCNCDEGWTGTFCDGCDEVNGWQDDGVGGCTDDPCSLLSCGDQICQVTNGMAECVCPAGTHLDGGFCVEDSECLATTCNMRGACDDDGGVIACRCDEGYTGERCAECDDAAGYHPDGAGGCTTDPCLPNPCGEPNKTVCSQMGSSYVCECETGYHDENGACVEDETCTNGSCSGNGTCDDTGGIVSCSCDVGYTGDTCDSCDAANGYHLDGMGGCTNDPCLPNPCTTVANKTQCVSQGMGFMCECESGYHPDGAGGCTMDPCTPDPCAASNQACRVNNGMAECYTPVCDDMNPCTDDALMNGSCVYTNVTDGTSCSTSACLTGESCTAGTCGGGSTRVCDDTNPCTDDVCDPTNGCEFVNDNTNIPDDGIACTEDTCSNGFASNTPTNSNCDNGLWCDGEEICAPTDQMAGADGCVTQNVPVAPSAPGPCAYYGNCSETTQSFELVNRAAGSTCNDGIFCTSGDACDTNGNCRGTASACSSFDCTTTSPFPTTIDIPDASVNLNITFDGSPLPMTGDDTTNHVLYAVAKDTGVRHILSSFWWDNFYTPSLRRTDTERLMPGIYDILYLKGQGGSDPGFVYRTNSSDIGPNGVRYVARDVFIYAGTNDIDVDIRQTNLTIDITLDGATLPTTGDDTSNHVLYAVAKDTGERHILSSFWWDDFYTPSLRRTDTERLMPGTYDILYIKGQGGSDPGFVYRTQSSDIGPNGVRYVARNVVVSGPSDTISVDIGQTDIALDITLDGQPLPTTGDDTSNHVVYAVARDTGERHIISSFWWDDFYTPSLRRTDAERLMPGTYDILYIKGQGGSDPGFVYRTQTSDIGPNGVRIIAENVQVSGSSQTLNLDIPDGDITLDITLDGQPLPTTGDDTTNHVLYAVAKDTGKRHIISSFWWDNFYTPSLRRTDAERLMPGSYDILYIKGEGGSDPGFVYRTQMSDIGPNGVRLVATNVVVGTGSNTIPIDIGQTPIQLDITLDGQPLPTTGDDTTNHVLYAVAKDTGKRHIISSFWWDNFYTPSLRRTDAERLMPGTYDILYLKGQGGSDPGFVYRTQSSDIGPNGVRLVATDVVVQGNQSQMLAIDIPDGAISYDIHLAGSPLPTVGDDTTNHVLYAVARDTGERHILSSFWWDNFYMPSLRRTDTERLMPGIYDILYLKGQGGSDPGFVYRTNSSDIGPNGVRYVGICYDVP